jgi:hypothetical protein
MKYALNIKDHNRQAHLDIEKDIEVKKNGLFTFTLRVNNGNITDYNVIEVVNARDRYLSIRKVTIQEYAIASDNRK